MFTVHESPFRLYYQHTNIYKIHKILDHWKPKIRTSKTIKIRKNAESKYVDTVNLRNVENELE